MKLKGIVPALVTPLTPDERVHEEQLRRVAEHLLSSGVHAIFVNGSMGGFNLLPDAEQVRAISIVVDQVRGRVPVMAGAADTATGLVVEKALQAHRFGADCISVLPPYYGRFSQTQMARFFQEVARQSPLPVLIYNNPWTTLSNIEADTIIALSSEPNIVGIKDSCNNLAQYLRLIRHFRGSPDFTVLLGTTHLMTYGLMLGADGIIEGLHNFTPRLAVDLYEAVQRGDLESAMELQARLERSTDVVKYGEVWGGVEAAMKVLGLCDKISAHPYVSITDPAEMEAVRAVVAEVLQVQPVGPPK